VTRGEETAKDDLNASRGQREALQVALYDLVANHFESLQAELTQLGKDFDLEEETVKELRVRFEGFRMR
jgi:hypothetical protein